MKIFIKHIKNFINDIKPNIEKNSGNIINVKLIKYDKKVSHINIKTKKDTYLIPMSIFASKIKPQTIDISNFIEKEG